MLTSSNQYLRPEYLTPLPTTLDAKKSPLALLAQTCSQIGADAPNAKLLQSAEKGGKTNNNKSETTSSRERAAGGNNVHDGNHRGSYKGFESSSMREKSRTPEDRSTSVVSTGSRVRTPIANSKNSNVSSRCGSNQSATSPATSPGTAENNNKTPMSESNIITNEDGGHRSKSNERNSPATPVSSATKTAFTQNILTSSSDPAIKDLPLGTFKPGVGIPVSSTFLSGYPSPGFSLPIDLMASSLISHHNMKQGALSPYLNYVRMKGPMGAETLAPICRDPYCAGCSISSHLLGAANGGAKTQTCPAGCTQCDHPGVKTSTASYLGHSPAAAAYAHAQLAALAAASHLPYVCNWIAGDAAYCGKRFSSSEELLQHLRTHTSVGSVSESGSSLSMLNSASLPPTHPLLHRTYPTPPLSPLATARYHPYSKPSLLPPTSTFSGFPLTHPGLSPYLSPYSLYGPRIGATPGMHP